MEFSWHLITGIAGEAREETGWTFYALLRDGQERSPAIITARRVLSGGGNYRGSNLSFKVGDDPTAVAVNRETLFRTLRLREDRVAWPEQVHGSLVVVASAPGECKAADGLVTSSPGLGLAILVADCVPVSVFSRDFSVVGLAHAGRKGTQADITKNLIGKIASSSGLAPSRLILALGPSIGPCCYELDPVTASQLPSRFVTERQGKFFFDLWSANAMQAREAGIIEENVVLPPACTCCRSDVFFSHRAQQARAGRQMAVTLPGGLQIRRDSGRGAQARRPVTQ